jgi:phosphate uptake regulator
MEYRRLISFGKNSYVISLPKAWIRQNKLKKGDLIYVEETGHNLLLNPKENTADIKDQEKVIAIDNKPLSVIMREVSSAYIRNNRTIIFKGKETSKKIKDIQNIVQNLIALEIMEQTTDSVIARDFLNMDKVSLQELLRKMDIVTRTMFKELLNMPEENNYHSIYERDTDVNRLYLLLYRAVIYNLENPMKAMKNYHLNSIQLLRIYMFSFYLEALADEVKRIARHEQNLKLSPAIEKKFKSLLNEINIYYLNSIKAMHSQDLDLAIKMSDKKAEIDLEIDNLEKEVIDIPQFNRIINHLRRLLTNIHNLGRITYTLVDLPSEYSTMDNSK